MAPASPPIRSLPKYTEGKPMIYFPLSILPRPVGTVVFGEPRLCKTADYFAIVGNDHTDVCVCSSREVAEHIKFALEQMPRVPAGKQWGVSDRHPMPGNIDVGMKNA